jgi:hypothetical protein
MKRAGSKYPLVLYTRMMDRWWPLVMLLGLSLLGLAWWLYSDIYGRLSQPWRWTTLGGIGGLVILIALLMLAVRKAAYVQLFENHLRLVTPLLHLRISYRRLKGTTTTGIGILFPPKSLSGTGRDILRPLLGRTAVVLEMTSLPLSRSALNLFLSPFFFKDRTPHLVILVDNWMGFATELESLRMGGKAPVTTARRPTATSILAKLPPK